MNATSELQRLLFAGASLAVACAPAPLPAPSSSQPALAPVPDAAASPGAPPEAATPEATPVASDAGLTAPPLGSNADFFRCGQSKCRARTETCCGASTLGVCLPSTPHDAPQGKVGYLKTEFEICDKETVARTGFSMSNIDHCDESVDCAGGDVCCDQFLFSGGTTSECTKLPAGGATPCEYGERCIESSSCRLPGTRCIDGYCQKPVTDLRCGETSCSGTTPVCCSDPQGCQAKCESEKRIRCTKRADCMAGQDCVMSGYGTDCTRLYIPGAMQPVCAKDGDCKRTCPDNPKKRTRCLPSDIPWLKTCQCPRANR